MHTSPGPVSTTEIADLLAWCRRLSQAGTGADPAERAAYLAAKAELLARIADEQASTSTWGCEHACQALQVARDAAAIAAKAAALLTGTTIGDQTSAPREQR